SANSDKLEFNDAPIKIQAIILHDLKAAIENNDIETISTGMDKIIPCQFYQYSMHVDHESITDILIAASVKAKKFSFLHEIAKQRFEYSKAYDQQVWLYFVLRKAFDVALGVPISPDFGDSHKFILHEGADCRNIANLSI